MAVSSSTRISDFLKPDHVAVDMVAASKSHLLRLLSETAAEALGIESEDILGALVSRETLGSTAVGDGVALPHAPVENIAAPFGLLVRLGKPIDFDAVDDNPVDIVFMLLFPADGSASCLQALACIAKRLRMPDVLKRIRSASDRQRLYSALAGDVEI